MLSIVIKMMFFINVFNYYVEKCFVNFFLRNIMGLLRPKFFLESLFFSISNEV